MGRWRRRLGPRRLRKFQERRKKVARRSQSRQRHLLRRVPSFANLFLSLSPLRHNHLRARTRRRRCTRCSRRLGCACAVRLRYAGRHTVVFADGNPNAELMFVGEGPGADEDAHGLPFVGKAGQLLNNMIAAMGVTRERGVHREHCEVPPSAEPHAGADRGDDVFAIFAAAD